MSKYNRKKGHESKYRRWTQCEDAFLTENYNKMRNEDLAIYFNRGIKKIYRRAVKLRLQKTHSFMSKQRSDFKKKFHSKHPQFFSMQKNGRWKGGIRKRTGYWLIKCRWHLFADAHGYYPQHRYNVEAIIGRFLKPEEVVHHINGRRDDNRICNLYIFDSSRNHMKYHSDFKYGNCSLISSSNLLNYVRSPLIK